MSQYTLDRFCQVILPIDFVCKVCSNILLNPMKCSNCALLKCENCQAEKTNCAHKFEQQDLVRKRIDDLLIKCRHYKHGCQKLAKVSQILQHEIEDCEYTKLKCDSKECELLSNNSYDIQHASKCGFFPIKCDLCHKEMKLQEKESHNCIKWLLSVQDTLNLTQGCLTNESEALQAQTQALFQSQTNEKAQIIAYLTDLQVKNKGLIAEKDRLQRELELETKTSDDQILQRLKGFQNESSGQLEEFYKKAQLDLDKHMCSVNDLMKGYLNNVTVSLEGLNVNVDKENKVLEKVSKEEIKAMREKSPLKVFVGTPQKKIKEDSKSNSSLKKKK